MAINSLPLKKFFKNKGHSCRYKEYLKQSSNFIDLLCFCFSRGDPNQGFFGFLFFYKIHQNGLFSNHRGGGMGMASSFPFAAGLKFLLLLENKLIDELVLVRFYFTESLILNSIPEDGAKEEGSISQVHEL